MHFKSFLDVGSVKTHVACWGRWVEENEPDEVIILIPGNPGIPGFYYSYLEEIFRITNIPVWVVGNAGHEEPTLANDMVLARIGPIQGREGLFNLQGQLLHKLDFIQRFTKPTTKIHLLGHSIGAWMVMELLKNENITSRIISANLLFPTLQKMADTPNGFWLNKIMRRVPFIILFIVWMFEKSPLFFKSLFIKTYCYFNGVTLTPILMDTILKYLCPSVIEKVLFLGFDEMDRVKQLDTATLIKNKNRVKIVHGYHDNWAPSKLFSDIQRIIPDLSIKKVPFKHVFVLNSSEQMAELTADIILKMK